MELPVNLAVNRRAMVIAMVHRENGIVGLIKPLLLRDTLMCRGTRLLSIRMGIRIPEGHIRSIIPDHLIITELHGCCGIKSFEGTEVRA
jgi:hypothetical protein